MSKIRKAYDVWSESYDSDINKTRDLEAIALKNALQGMKFDECLEIGCGTGKNTIFLSGIAKHVTAVDFSEKMISVASEKIKSDNVIFVKADINNNWDFAERKYDLITFSLVLEHIKETDEILRKASVVSDTHGYLYIGELHPFRQYSGVKARFDNKDGRHVLECYVHNVSDFTNAGIRSGYQVLKIDEFSDNDDKKEMPRILSILFQKN